MPINDALLTIGAAAMQTAAGYVAIHTAIPDDTGSNESVVDREAVPWETAADGDMVCTTEIVFTGGTPGGPVACLGFWSAATDGTYYGYGPTAGDETFDANGEYRVSEITVPGNGT